MALFALDGKNAEDVREIYHDDFLSCSAEKLIKIAAALPEANPEFVPLTLKVLTSVEKESAAQRRHGVLLYLSAAAARHSYLTEKLLPVFEKNSQAAVCLCRKFVFLHHKISRPERTDYEAYQSLSALGYFFYPRNGG